MAPNTAMVNAGESNWFIVSILIFDGFYSFDSPKTFEHIDEHGHENNRHEGARYFVGDTGSVGNDENTEYSYAQRPEIGGLDVLEVSDPLGYEIGGDAVHR